MKQLSGMIFAAGLGTRLYPLTADKPKALVVYKGKTLLQWAIEKLKTTPVSQIVVNTHHYSDQIVDFVSSRDWGIPVHISDESDLLLDTAGGFKKAEDYFQKSSDILLYNVDIISSIDLNLVIQQHYKSDSYATLVVKDRETSRKLIFDKQQMQLSGWINYRSGEKIICREAAESLELGFSGIHVVKREILGLIPPNKKVSFTPFYLEIAKEYPVIGYLDEKSEWKDMGKIEDFTE